VLLRALETGSKFGLIYLGGGNQRKLEGSGKNQHFSGECRNDLNRGIG
jgi:hypothetical protein